MRILKFAAFLIVLIFLAVLLNRYASAPPQTATGKSLNIVFVYKTTSGSIEFWNSITEGIEAASNEYEVDYQIIGALEEADIEGNMRAVEDAIGMNPDAIILTASDYVLLEPYAKLVSDSGILLLTLDSDVSGGYSQCFVATDNIMLGRLMGEEIKKRTPDDGKIGVIGHIKGSDTAIARVSGIREVLGSRALDAIYCDNNAEKSKEQTLELISQNPDLTGIIATNELSALGVSMAVDQLGLGDSVAVVTCDNSSRQITYLEQGVIDATVTQKPFNMGYMSVAIACGLLSGKNTDEIPAFYDTGCEVITRDNMFTMENQKLLFPFRE